MLSAFAMNPQSSPEPAGRPAVQRDVVIDPTLGAAAPGEFAVHEPATPLTPPPDRRFVTAAMMIVMVLSSMEQTVTSTAMPTIIGDLHGLEHYSWVASIYLLACTISMPIYGRLADALGRKPIVLAAIGLFIGASVLAAFSTSMGQLIAFRGLQGLGAGGIMPVVLTILGDIFTLEERAKIQGFFSAVWGTAALAGPALGAFLVNTLGWRSIFFINLPLGLIGLLVLAWKYHDHEKPHTTDLDLPGVACLTLACSSLLLVTSGVGESTGSWLLSAGLLLVAALTGAYFIWHERRAANPIMAPGVLLHRAIGPSLFCSLLLGLAFLSLDTFVPLYVQGGRGGGAAAAAGVVTPVMLTWAFSGIIAAPLVVRWGFRRTSALGSLLIIAGFGGLVLGTVFSAPHAVLTATLAVTGLGFGPASMAYLLAAQNAVTWHERGLVTSSITFFRTIGGALGVGLLGALFNLAIAPRLAQLRARGATPAQVLDPRGATGLSPALVRDLQHMICGGLLWVFVAMLAFAVLQLILTLRMPDGRPDAAVKASDLFEAAAG